jgi:hypothetical protein
MLAEESHTCDALSGRSRELPLRFPQERDIFSGAGVRSRLDPRLDQIRFGSGEVPTRGAIGPTSGWGSSKSSGRYDTGSGSPEGNGE